jgi:hypothetical protein
MRRVITAIALAAAAAQPSFAQRTSSDTPFHWSGEVANAHWVYVRNLNGAVRVEAGTGNKVEVTARKQWRRGNPDDVKITVTQVGSGKGDLLICAVWNAADSCDEDGYRSHNRGWNWGNNDNRNDVSVEFTITLPAGVKVDASTVNGELDVDGVASEVIATTVNGSVSARSTGGPVRAKTVNGQINVRTGAVEANDVEYSTVNGSITIELPALANANLDMRTTNGSVSSDFPVTVEGTFSARRMRGTVGKGGPTIKLSTVNGSIRLRKA